MVVYFSSILSLEYIICLRNTHWMPTSNEYMGRKCGKTLIRLGSSICFTRFLISSLSESMSAEHWLCMNLALIGVLQHCMTCWSGCRVNETFTLVLISIRVSCSEFHGRNERMTCHISSSRSEHPQALEKWIETQLCLSVSFFRPRAYITR